MTDSLQPELPRGVRRLPDGSLTLAVDHTTWPAWLRPLGPADRWFTTGPVDRTVGAEARAVVAMAVAPGSDRTWTSQARQYFAACIAEGKVGWRHPGEPDAGRAAAVAAGNDDPGPRPYGPDPAVLCDQLVAAATDTAPGDGSRLLALLLDATTDAKRARLLHDADIGPGRIAIGTAAARVDALDRLAWEHSIVPGVRTIPVVVRTLAGLKRLFPDTEAARSEVFTVPELETMIVRIGTPGPEEWRDAALVLVLSESAAGGASRYAVAGWKWGRDVVRDGPCEFTIRVRTRTYKIAPDGAAAGRADGAGRVCLADALEHLAHGVRGVGGVEPVFAKDRLRRGTGDASGPDDRTSQPEGFSAQGMRDHIAALCRVAGVSGTAWPKRWTGDDVDWLVDAALLPLRDARDRTMITMAYAAGGLRRSETTSFDHRDAHHRNDDLWLYLPWSKTDQTMTGRGIAVPGRTGGPLDANALVAYWSRRYARAAGVTDIPGTWPLFPRLDGRFALRRAGGPDSQAVPDRLAPQGAGLIFTGRFRDAGLSGVTSHGVRASLISHLLELGLTKEHVAARTGQTPDVALGYWAAYREALDRRRAYRNAPKRDR